MIQKIIPDSVFGKRFFNYFLIISALFFLFALGPQLLVDQFSSSKPNTALAQDEGCGQEPCPPVPVPPQPPQECSTSCPAGKEGTCGGHKYWDEAAGAYGECQCETESQTCQAPQPTQPPAQQCTPDEVVGTTQHCVGQQMCTFNIHHRADCSTYEGGAFGCQNSASCGFTTPPPPAPNPPPPSTCTDHIFDCSCTGTTQQCMHQHADCTTSVESNTNSSACQSNTPPPPPSSTCTDQIFGCSCSGTTLVCQHRHSDCSVTTENTTNSSSCQPGNPPQQGGNSSSNSNSTSNSSSNSAANSNSNSSANASANQSQNQTQNQSQSQTSVNTNNNNNTNNNSQNQTVNVAGTSIVWVTPAPASSPAPTATPVSVTSQCPSGTTFQRMEGGTIFCTQNTTGVVVGQGGGVAAPKVVGKTQVQGTIQELPNTGLPAAGLLLVGLGPIGWKLRKTAFRNFNPAEIWTSRELKR